MVFGAIMSGKYLLVLPIELRGKIKQEARKHSMTMNDYIVTVLEQFMAIQAGDKNGNIERVSGEEISH